MARQFGERRPFDEFHDESDAFGALLEPMNLRDVLVIQRGKDFGFALKSGRDAPGPRRAPRAEL
jgi:hypothetical protein